MFKDYLKGIDGIANYPMFSLLVFFVFFIAVFVWAFKANKEDLEKISRIPLESDDNSYPNSKL